jgi:hypothetical protein
MKKLILMALFLSGCTYSIKEVNTSKADPEGVRQCLAQYNLCTQGGPVVGFKTETYRACKESYEICINSCEKR